PTMGGIAGSWTWSATNETSGNRWEILGASAPAISGLPGDLFGQSPQQLGTATYNPPSGTTARLTWMPQGVASPYVSGASGDNASDAVLLFATDPFAITGFSGSVQSQEVVGIGLDCGLDPCGIPTDILYNQLNWSVPADVSVNLIDTFTRTVSNGWGLADTGQSYTQFGGAASDYSVNGTQGLQLHTAVNSFHGMITYSGSPDFDLYVDNLISVATASGASITNRIAARLSDTSNYYYVPFPPPTRGACP